MLNDFTGTYDSAILKAPSGTVVAHSDLSGLASGICDDVPDYPLAGARGLKFAQSYQPHGFGPCATATYPTSWQYTGSDGTWTLVLTRNCQSITATLTAPRFSGFTLVNGGF